MPSAPTRSCLKEDAVVQDAEWSRLNPQVATEAGFSPPAQLGGLLPAAPAPNPQSLCCGSGDSGCGTCFLI